MNQETDQRLQEIRERLARTAYDGDSWTDDDIQFLLDLVDKLNVEIGRSRVMKMDAYFIDLQQENTTLKQTVSELRDSELKALRAMEEERQKLAPFQSKLTLAQSVVEKARVLVSVAELYSAEHNNDFKDDIEQFDEALKKLEKWQEMK